MCGRGSEELTVGCVISRTNPGWCVQARTLRLLRVPPGNRLEALKGDRVGQFSIRVNDQYRICFRWENGEAHDVELCDYH